MDRVPKKLPNTASRLIAMAVSLVGSAQEVMAHMKCLESDFPQYCDGQKEPSWPELDRLVTLIVREQDVAIARNRQLLAETRARQKKPEK